MAGAMNGPAQPAEVVLDGIEVDASIGRGGMGEVYLGRQVSLDRDVAVKVLASELASDPLFLERLEREARVMARLRHPNIVAVHDFRRAEGRAAIVMEFIDGGSLREKMRGHPNGLPVDEALRLLRQIAAGLQEAHAAGIIHRDMKPENVLVDRSGKAMVTDFGLALPLHEQTTRFTLTGAAVGTMDYMAPEQLRGAAMDARLDVYALGVIAYELLTGTTPRGSFDAPQRVRADVPAHVSHAVMLALRPDPAERLPSIGAFIRLLDAPRRKRWPWVAATLAAAVAIIVAILWPKPPPPAPGPWRDAIAGTRIREDVISGDWVYASGTLTSGADICIVKLEQDLPASYDVRMVFTRNSGVYSVGLFFAAGGMVASAEIDSWGEELAGVQTINGEDLRNGYGFRFPLTNGRRCELLLEVRRDTVRITLDGELKKTFAIAGKTLGVTDPWMWNPKSRPAALAIGSYQSPTRFESVEWREVPQGAP